MSAARKLWAKLGQAERLEIFASFRAEAEAKPAPDNCPRCHGERHWLAAGFKSGQFRIHARCHTCHKETQRRDREKSGGAANRNKRWERFNREKAIAHRKVESALSRGALIRKPCQRCGSNTAQAHHDDYAKPLSVTWLCPKHHAERHREIGTSPLEFHEAAE